MKTHHPLSHLALACIGSLLATSAIAQMVAKDSGYYYGGINIGQARSRFDNQAIANSVLTPGQTSVLTGNDLQATGYKAFLGYQMTRNWGLELGYFDLGRHSFTAATTPAGTLAGDLKIMGANLDLVGTLPITEKFAAQARIGGNFARTTTQYTTTGAATLANPSPSKRATNVKVGVGLQYAFTPSVLMRADMERFRVNDASNHDDYVDLVSVGLVFPFGRMEQAPVRAAAAPAYVAPPPPPEPPVVVLVPVAPPPAPPPPAPPVVLKRVSYSAESVYGFDHSNLQPAGKRALDTFATELQGMKFDQVVVEGHTDRLGTTEYNQKLSQERADKVKSYLVTEGKLDPGKVSAIGKSESMPITKPGDCKGTAANAKLITCLAPDRRVDIEVTGTR